MSVSRLFNAYVILGWNAASKPAVGDNGVWIGVLKRDVRFRLAFEAHNPPTRAEAEKKLAAILDDFKSRGEKVLLGADFPLGLPRGLADGLKLPAEIAPWRAVWDQLDRMVKDKADNTNNRFGVGSEINRRLTGGPFPFWGCPPKDALTTLHSKRGRAHTAQDLPEFRHVELTVKGAPPVWKLFSAGSVGGQAILGIPMLRRLKLARGEAMTVWPFETGFKTLGPADLDGVDVMAVEVHQALYKATSLAGELRDQAQIRATAEHFGRLDEAGRLGEAFATPKAAAADALVDAEREEGWMLTGL